MAFQLIVTQPFAEYAKGECITDPAKVESILSSNASHVVKVTAPDPADTKPAQPQPEADH